VAASMVTQIPYINCTAATGMIRRFLLTDGAKDRFKILNRVTMRMMQNYLILGRERGDVSTAKINHSDRLVDREHCVPALSP